MRSLHVTNELRCFHVNPALPSSSASNVDSTTPYNLQRSLKHSVKD